MLRAQIKMHEAGRFDHIQLPFKVPQCFPYLTHTGDFCPEPLRIGNDMVRHFQVCIPPTAAQTPLLVTEALAPNGVELCSSLA